MRDILDLFGELPNYPGKTKPKNRVEDRAGRDSGEDPFFGVPKKIVTINGEKKTLYTVGSTARILGRTAQTVRIWERKGWIPAPTYRSSKASGSTTLNPESRGYRLYSKEQVEVLLEALGECNLLAPRSPSWQEPANWVAFITHIKATWPK